MATSAEEFREILNAEMMVDMSKLMMSARYGVPPEIRAEVWKYLLGVASADKSMEMTAKKVKWEEYRAIRKENAEVMKPLRGEARRYKRARGAFFKSRAEDLEQHLENVVLAYLNQHHGTRYASHLVHICGVFAYLMNTETEMYFGFERLLNQLVEHFAVHDLNERMAHFLMLFRSLLPDLYNHFEEEEVSLHSWMLPWIQFLLAKELSMPCLMRLWDTYFSAPDGLGLHVYVLLAILSYCKDSLEELEQSEILSMLLRLPHLDMDQIISHAYRIRYEVQARALTEI
ncbi:hypothetical protein CXG81DRAFT_29592 [Caulochytrium protostelioides]|uniref:Rab-GAP TBC domain-containing protein n=1 Tax=Caulochytrium protostelioides TaxID=1555241 RepID=A0A4V1IUX5_9FUNG|nr:hypothetical protein CXG81DRAFT_29592 [Caulochytrium protostelioides]|eukprot:RKP02079.1 hypothetical protein CXG81DRAFT_29592 [Caulochytrium protostelioides]